MGSRQGFRERRRRRKAARDRLAAKTEVVRAEARRAAGEREPAQRSDRRARHRSQLAELRIRARGASLETRRRTRLGLQGARRRLEPAAAGTRRALRPVGASLGRVLTPVGRALGAALAPVAPYVSRGLFLVLRAVAALAEGVLAALGWGGRLLAAGLSWAEAHVTPARAAAAIAIVSALVLAVAQFVVYRGIEIGGDQYQGGIAPPSLERESAGEPTYYLLVPLSIAAVICAWLALRGRPALGRVVAGIGLLALTLTLVVDLPQGLDTGALGEAYEGTRASLLTGFWMQLVASVALALSGVALAMLAPRESSQRPAPRPRRRSGTEGGAGETRGGAAAGSGAGA